MSHGSTHCDATSNCDVCDCTPARNQASPASLSDTMGLCAIEPTTNLDSKRKASEAFEDRVARGQRLLQQSNERVKKARIQAKRDQLQAEFLASTLRLDQANLALAQAEEFMDTCPVRLIKGKQQNITRLQDKRQLFLMEALKAEEAILDYDKDE
jgi:hypothetical protein